MYRKNKCTENVHLTHERKHIVFWWNGWLLCCRGKDCFPILYRQGSDRQDLSSWQLDWKEGSLPAAGRTGCKRITRWWKTDESGPGGCSWIMSDAPHSRVVYPLSLVYRMLQGIRCTLLPAATKILLPASYLVMVRCRSLIGSWQISENCFHYCVSETQQILRTAPYFFAKSALLFAGYLYAVPLRKSADDIQKSAVTGDRTRIVSLGSSSHAIRPLPPDTEWLLFCGEKASCFPSCFARIRNRLLLQIL